MGIFIGGSLLYLYQVSISFLQRIITKFKSRLLGNNSTMIEELKIESDDGGQDEKRNDKIFEITQNITSTPNWILYPGNENSNRMIFHMLNDCK